MGTWFSSNEQDKSVKAEAPDAKIINQSADSPIIQLNWATFSTGLSSIAIILVLLVILAILYKKNRRSNRRARRAELHDILHSIHRASKNAAPAPSRGGYPGNMLSSGYPGFQQPYTCPVPTITFPQPGATAPSSNLGGGPVLPAITYEAPGLQATTPGVVRGTTGTGTGSGQSAFTYGSSSIPVPQISGYPGVNSGANRRIQQQANNHLKAIEYKPDHTKPVLSDQTPVFPQTSTLKAITFPGDKTFKRQDSVIIPILKPGDKPKPLGLLYKGVVPLSRKHNAISLYELGEV